MSRDYQAEDASRTRGKLTLRLTDKDRDALTALAERLGATTQANAILGAVAATRALLAGDAAGVALAAARDVATAPPAPRGWTKGKPRKT